MKNLFVISILPLLIFSCNTTPNESLEENEKIYADFRNKNKQEQIDAYNALSQDYIRYRKDSLDLVKKKFNQILELNKIVTSLTKTTPKLEKKDIALNMDNLLFYHSSIFDRTNKSSIHNSHSIKFNDIEKLIYNDTVQLANTSKTSDIETFNSIFNHTKFHINSPFLNSKYVLIQADLEIKAPKLINKAFEQGYYKGHAILFDLDKNTLIDNFIFEVYSSENVELTKYLINGKESYSGSTISDEQIALNKDYFDNIHKGLEKELEDRYTVAQYGPIYSILPKLEN